MSFDAGRFSRDHPRYKWVALSNTTLGVLIITINSSIVIIALPAIFNGIRLDPLAPGNVSYLLWMIMGVPAGLRRAGGSAGPARRPVRAGPRLPVRVRDLHDRVGGACPGALAGRRRGAVADRLAAGAGRRRGDAVRQLHRDRHRRVRPSPARHG